MGTTLLESNFLRSEGGMGKLKRNRKWRPQMIVYLDSATTGTLAVHVWEVSLRIKLELEKTLGHHLRSESSREMSLRSTKLFSQTSSAFRHPTTWPFLVCQGCDTNSKNLQKKDIVEPAGYRDTCHSPCDPSPLPNITFKPVGVSRTLCWGRTIRWNSAGN